MEKEVFDAYVKAGEIAVNVQQLARKNAKPGKKLLELAGEIESKTLELGGGIAFPANLSRNHQAAHYTPSFDDETVIGEKDVLKIDIGVHINGYVADCAFTIDFSGEHGKLVEASTSALEAAVSMAKAGVNVRDIGKAIQGEITKRGYKPISNLSGHRVAEFHLHAGDNIPNVESGNYVLQEGDSFAIEPFATNGFGQVTDGPEVEIFLATGLPPRARLPSSRKIAQFIADNYKLPFAKRWLYAEFSDLPAFSINAAIRELEVLGVISPYPVLVEKNKGVVSQAETTVLITEDGLRAIVPVP